MEIFPSHATKRVKKYIYKLFYSCIQMTQVFAARDILPVTLVEQGAEKNI